MIASSIERRFGILRHIAQSPGISPEALCECLGLDGLACGPTTLYQEIAVLKKQGLLATGRHRKGYFLKGANFSAAENQLLLGGLRMQAEDLGHPHASTVYGGLKRRLEKGELADSPIEAIANYPVTAIDDAFQDVMAYLRGPIQEGRSVSLTLTRNPWGSARARMRFIVYPLQFIFHDVAWYLLAEHVDTECFATFRIDRLHPAITLGDPPGRGARMQAERTEIARQLLRAGWGMALAPHGPDGALRVELATVRLLFVAEAAPFIAENHRRHESQTLEKRGDGALIFQIELPRAPAIFLQFRRWVLSWGPLVEVLAPAFFRAEIEAEISRTHQLYFGENSANL